MPERKKIYLDAHKNFLALPEEFSNPEYAHLIVLPVPYERTSTFGKGSKRGPKEIINASHEVELYDAVLGYEPYQTCGGIATMSPLKVKDSSGAKLASILENEVSYWLEQGKFVITIGGEHSSIVGAVYAHTAKYKPLTIIQLDAHSDLRSSYLEDTWNHACAMARVLDRHNGNLVQIGIRSEAPEEPEILKILGDRVSTIYAHKIKINKDRVIEEILDAVSENVYITFDCDVFDPGIIPATGTPEPGGLDWDWVNHFFEVLAHKRQIVGFDVSELSPIPYLHYPQFTIAKLIYRLIGYIFSLEQSY